MEHPRPTGPVKAMTFFEEVRTRSDTKLCAGVDGIAADPDGSRLFLANSDTRQINVLSLPDAVMSLGPMVQLEPGYGPTGLIVDGAGHLIVKASVNNNTVVAGFPAP